MSLLDVTDFVHYINNDVEYEKKIIYVAIGSAMHMMQNINGQSFVDIKYDQQYPLFLRKINNKHHDHHVYIILIDPLLEKPSFTVSYANQLWKKNDVYDNLYEYENITLFEFRNNITFGNTLNIFVPRDAINIDDTMNKLNVIAKYNKWFVIVMDYTGNDLYNIASNYDKTIGCDNNHIFYGLPARNNNGCYVDLSDPSTFFITNTRDGYLTAFTPYNHPNLKNYYEYIKKNHDEESQIMVMQTKIYINKLITTLKNDVVALYRRLLTHRNNIKNGKELFEFNEREYDYVVKKYDLKNINKMIDSNLDFVILNISNIMDKEMKYIANLLAKNDLYELYLTRKHNDDPYKLYSDLCCIINLFIS